MTQQTINKILDRYDKLCFGCEESDTLPFTFNILSDIYKDIGWENSSSTLLTYKDFEKIKTLYFKTTDKHKLPNATKKSKLVKLSKTGESINLILVDPNDWNKLNWLQKLLLKLFF